MSVFLADKRDYREELELGRHPLYTRQLGVDPGVLRSLRDARSSDALYDAHRVLLRQAYAVERVDDEFDGVLRDLRAAMPAAKRAGQANVRALAERIAIAQGDVRAARATLSLYRTLADALAWKAFRYRRPAITALGQGSWSP